MQVFHGFIFLRFAPVPQPDMASLLAPFDKDFAAYRLREVVPVPTLTWLSDLPVNRKSVRDEDNEACQVALAHPGLQEVYGRSYRACPCRPT